MRERSVHQCPRPVILLVAFLLTSGAAMAAGPFSHTGVSTSGPDWLVINYPNVTSTQTQRVTLELNTGNALSSSGHWGIGLRGPSYDNQYPLGRGIAFGYLSGTANAWCDGVAVEDFSVNLYIGAGIVPNTCQWFTFQPNTVYRFEVTATYNDVSYTVSQRFYDAEFRRWIWEPVLSGGCYETAGQPCTQYSADGDAGDAFVGSTYPVGYSWSASNMYVTHW